jgi:hypothetical protein
LRADATTERTAYFAAFKLSYEATVWPTVWLANETTERSAFFAAVFPA